MTQVRKLVAKFLARPPEVRFEQVRSLLEAFGYFEVRSRGSHHTFENAAGDVIVIPIKGGQKVKGFYVKRIVEFLDLENWQDE